jgi:hypothetical protein
MELYNPYWVVVVNVVVYAAAEAVVGLVKELL